MEGGRIKAARLAFGGVALKPWRSKDAEALLAGAEPSREAFERAATKAVEGARGQGENDFKPELARRVAVRAFLLAARGTPAELPALPASPFAGDLHA
jgi:xanthine dehydrogenase YagS FAD-binding subunit